MPQVLSPGSADTGAGATGTDHIASAAGPAASETCGGTMDRMRLCASELIGTFVLVLIGVGSVSASLRSVQGADLLGIAAAFGLAVAVVVAATGHISGAHINPAVTLALLVTRKIRPADAVLYWVAQLLGAVLAAGALEMMLGDGAALAGSTNLRAQVSVPQGVAIEAVLTFILVLV